MVKIVLAFALSIQMQVPPDGSEVPPAAASGPHAAASGPHAAGMSYDGSARQLDIEAPRIMDPRIAIDGRLDDAAWADAAVLTGFTQFDPIEGAPASERTEVRVIVAADAVYFSVRALDSSGGVRATLTDRDGYGRSDDYVRFILDTFNDQRRAYVFMVNPLGVQGDGLWVEGRGGRGGPIDWSPDFLWESAGRVDAHGYSAELKIPFKSMRFPDADVQDWGLQIQRSIRRTGYEQSWAPITRDEANGLAQSGSIRALEGIDPGMFLEFNPTMVGSKSGRWDDNLGQFARGSSNGEFGLNVAYGLTSNLTLDGTLNPDFSQVEADAGQIVVNERFALFLREQRPFFLEGADIFSMPKQIVYTRSIVNPVGAAKLSGKIGAFNVAYLGAVDELNGGASSPVVNLLRVKRDLGRTSTMGAVYTDRTESGDGFNRVLGADARLVLGGRYTVEMMAAGSADGAGGAPTNWGSLFTASVNRASRSLSMSASFEDVGAGFRAGSGFIRRTGVTQFEARTGYTFRGKRGALLEQLSPSIEVQGYWDRDDFWAGRGTQEREVNASLNASLRDNIGGYLNYRRSDFDFAPSYYAGFGSGSNPDNLAPISSDRSLYSGLESFSVRSWISSWERVRPSFGASVSDTPIFSSGVPVDLGRTWSADASLTLVPNGQFQATLGARHVKIFRQRDDSEYSSATIPRLQLRYQLSRALFIRGVGEYSSQVRGNVLDPVTGQQVYSCSANTCSARTGSDAHDFGIETLLAYEPSPGTVFFLGYTRQWDDTSGFRFQDVRADADGLFVKLSYRFRM
jgi:hypothetical protein